VSEKKQRPTVEPQFITRLHDKDFVVFAGLLDLGHQKGLCGIKSEVIAELSRPAEEVWVVRATGRFQTEGGEELWSAYGDAGPKNSQMKGAYLRHAETRAAARMLRMATNVGMTALEEMGPDGTDPGEQDPPRTQQPPRQSAARNPAQPQQPASGGEEARMVADSADAEEFFCSECGQKLTPKEVAGSRKKGWPMLCVRHAQQLVEKIAARPN
jgi:hypothetical protein